MKAGQDEVVACLPRGAKIDAEPRQAAPQQIDMIITRGWEPGEGGEAGALLAQVMFEGLRACPDALGAAPSPGLQTVLPSYLRERFVAAALSYIACGSAGELVCRRSDCRCQCQPAFPRCNCPEADIQALESSLAQLGRAWESHHSQFEESGEAGRFHQASPTP